MIERYPPLSPEFYKQSTVDVAQALLGKLLLHRTAEGTAAGIIVETEAYLWDDPACHASKKMTPRNAPMFGHPGFSYVYFTYGMHYCMNVATAPEGIGEAVLIRALEPVEGLDLMSLRRRTTDPLLLCSGPGRLTQALAIGKDQNRVNLSSGNLQILDMPAKNLPIIRTTRIGIRLGKDLLLRFYLANSIYISRRLNF